MKRILSSHSIWLFDTDRMRFRRVPKDVSPEVPPLERDWERYYALEVDAETGSFTVSLNQDGTRLLRSWSEDGAIDLESEDRTVELALDLLQRRLES